VRRARSTCARPGGGSATARWEALGTTVVLRVADPLWLPRASAILTRELDAIDRACSRFRPDSDLSRVNAHAGGRPVSVAPLLVQALELALRAAELTNGDVDPTIGAALVLAGYDRDWSLLRAEGGLREVRGGPPAAAAPGARPTLLVRRRSGYRTVELDPVHGLVRVPRGVALDLGATAKAWVADRGARAVHEAAGCGVLVGIGGDLAFAGPAPAGGWRVHVTDDHRSGPDAPGQTVSFASGGLATSSVAVRRWRRGAQTLHHIIDPALGVPARGPWRTVSVAAADCADANIAATAALVRGTRAPRWLQELGLPARLVAHDGAVVRVGGWPAEGPPQRRPPACAPAAVAGHGGPKPGDTGLRPASPFRPARTGADPALRRADAPL
jgi:thiamine biosynthesis lipoprotein ApbE